MAEPAFRSYARSPVREAIFSVTFQVPVEWGLLRAFCATSWASQHYAPAQAADVDVDLDAVLEQPGPLGYVLHSPNRNALLRLTTTQFHYHRLGEYPGWAVASAAFLEAWQQLVAFGVTVTSQEASIRYINQLRLDIPVGGALQLSDYLELLPSLPKELPGSPGPFFLQLQTLNPEHDLHGLITEVVDFTAGEPARVEVVLDIRVSYSPTKTPVAAVSLAEFLPLGRAFKNQLFESCITPTTRALFT